MDSICHTIVVGLFILIFKEISIMYIYSLVYYYDVFSVLHDYMFLTNLIISCIA
jgi:hypothetical protein